MCDGYIIICYFKIVKEEYDFIFYIIFCLFLEYINDEFIEIRVNDIVYYIIRLLLIYRGVFFKWIVYI